MKIEFDAAKKRRLEKRRKVAGLVIAAAIVFFLARLQLGKVPAYQEIEEGIIGALGLRDRSVDDNPRLMEAKLRRETELAERPRLEVALLPPPSEPSRYRVTPLIDKEYLPAVLQAISRAEKSVYVAMFMAAPDPPRGPVIRLLNELIAAARRGVKVKVALNHPGKKDDAVLRHNRAAISYLKEGGVDAYFNDPGKSLHDKFVLIDDGILFIGNHNWTKEALTLHLELSLMVVSVPPDPAFARHFGSIVLAKWEETPDGMAELIDRLQRELLQRSRKSKSADPAAKI